MKSWLLLSSPGKQLQLTLATFAYLSQLLVYLPYEIQIRGETWGQLPATSYVCLQSAGLRTSTHSTSLWLLQTVTEHKDTLGIFAVSVI